MIVFLEGKYEKKTPGFVWMNVNGVGYEVNISIHTYSSIQHDEKGRLLTYLQIKEDGHSLYGFFDTDERNLFLQLISVSGIGANTARMMLSSMKPEEIVKAILHDDDKTLEKIKGIGAKSAKRLILELKDKVQKLGVKIDINATTSNNNMEEDALNALISLGIAKASAQVAIQKSMKQQTLNTVEEIVKQALKNI